MEEKKIVVNGKEFTIRELKYVESVRLQDMSKEEMAKAILKFSIGLSDEEIENLSLKEGIELQQKINEVNNLNENFPTPTTETVK